MTPERWQRVKAVVADALERDPAERDDFVASQCAGDTALRREVESMLEQSGAQIDRCVERLNNARSAPDDALAGTRLGAYEILRETGRGGMGAVYLARRADKAFEKEVAIKLLKRGTDTDEVLRRFRAERQILARLDHPNIARLLDGGTTPEGLPYFVMEYVDGVPITDFCAAQDLSIRHRVELILKVCAAVQFAHRNLVVHRDIKPGNVLITRDGEPKLLDFGIAKLLASDGEFPEVTLRDEQRLTPAYASPEQVRGEPITTLSDVYSLGALLYQLLADRSPHAFAVERPTATELLRVIGEQEPPRASSVAPTQEMRRALRGDLDNILLTALRKEPERRYSGVTAFAEDLRRYLENRTVRAHPPTFGYTASRFIARNKLGVAAAALLLVSLLGGITATAWQARRARIEEERAQRRFTQVRKLARAVVFDYHDMIASLRGSTPARERLVKDAIEYLDALAREAGDDRELLREVATAYAKVGRVQGNSYFANLGDVEGAMRSYRTSLAIRERLLAADPNNLDLQEEASASHEGVGDMLYTVNDLRGALASYERAAELRERTLAAKPDNLLSRLDLAHIYSHIGDVKGMEQYANLGDTAGALAACRKAQELLEPYYEANRNNTDFTTRFASVLSRVGMLAATSGDVAGALAVHRRAVALMQEAVAAHPNSQTFASELLAARHWLRFALEDNNELSEAIAQSRALIAEFEGLLASDPRNVLLRRNQAVTHNMLGKNLLLTGNVRGALEAHRTALVMCEQLVADTNSTDHKTDLAISLLGLGKAEAAQHDYDSALQRYRQALALREPMVTPNLSNARARDDVSSIYAEIGNALTATNDFLAAAETFSKSLRLAEEISAQAPSNARLRARLATRLAEAGKSLARAAELPRTGAERTRAEWQRAREYLTRSVTLWDELRNNGTLMPADAHKPEQVARDLAACEAALQ